MTDLDYKSALATIVRETLLQRLTAAGFPASELGDGTKLFELGLIDSEDLVEVILEVEERCQCEFDPTAIDLEGGLTLAGFTRSFAVRR